MKNAAVSSPIAPTVAMTAFTAEQWEALASMRTRYPRGADFFSVRELA